MAIAFLLISLRFVRKGKQSIKDHDLEFYSQATWEGLLLVPALDTMFSLCLVHHLISCKQECILQKGKGRACNYKKKEKEECVTSSSCYSSLVPRPTRTWVLKFS